MIATNVHRIALTWVFPKAIVLTTKPRLDVKRRYGSMRGLLAKTIALRENHADKNIEQHTKSILKNWNSFLRSVL